ncbi:MAG: aspartate carbamoyltransferase regulatory subunit [Methanobacteriaceae archaeon]|jgi:aspartate carbamoyltransferase regulatory subunit|nr:aspartate carbamoyltransferase regulatory subunit [Methanobacteriaceae archaeon]
MKKPELKVKPIKDGTVIDHITANKSLYVLRILGLPDGESSVSLAINVSSSNGEKKDIVKIENRELDNNELDQVALISPKATINIIRNYEIASKAQVTLQEELDSIIKCINPKCISNTAEPIKSKFYVLKRDPITLRCHYCERLISEDEINKQF